MGVRLGFWNRLAIATGVVTTLVLPTWIVISENVKASTARFSGYQLCADVAGKAGAKVSVQECADIWLGHPDPYGWSAWVQFAGATAAACVALYLLIALFAATAKWVWRGRRENQPQA